MECILAVCHLPRLIDGLLCVNHTLRLTQLGMTPDEYTRECLRQARDQIIAEEAVDGTDNEN